MRKICAILNFGTQVVANLSLTPLVEPISEITEGLRAGEYSDYSEPLARMDEQLARLKALA